MINEIGKFLIEENNGRILPEIRYFDGTEMFSDKNGNYKSKTLEGSLELFLKELKQSSI